MASESIQPDTPAKPPVAQLVSQEMSAGEIALEVLGVIKLLLAPLASLKLSVFLLFMSVVVVFIATLQQNWMDMWAVKQMHYGSWILAIPYKHLFVEHWFPNYQNVPGAFYIPSGKAIIVALLINITTAHVLRFQIKARGIRLLLGLGVAIIAALVTFLIAFNNLGANGFQKDPPISYLKMWQVMQFVILGLSLIACVAIFLQAKGDWIRKSFLGTFAFIGFASLGIIQVLGDSSFIGDNAMRVMWQLAQATMAACVGWVACLMLFKRKAGIVLLHIGVSALMVNELYVTYTNDETRIQFVEGEGTSRAFDTRETEFFIVDQSDPEKDTFMVISESQLRSGEWIDGEELPFKVHCVSFLENSTTPQPRRTPDASVSGIGKFRSTELVGNFNSEQVDIAAAIVELETKDGESLGNQWLASQWFTDMGFAFEEPRYLLDSVTVDGKKYAFGLRYRTVYKPYKLDLHDAQAEYYPGTTSPSWFSSKVTLTDLSSGAETNREIYMNSPLRYDGETFYQSSYRDLGAAGEQSELQVVKNHGWMIPYICCMFTVVGLGAQFCSSLIAHLIKATSPSKSVPPTADLVPQASPAPVPGSKFRRFFPATVGLLSFLFFGGLVGLAFMMASKPIETEAGLRLDRFGKIPILNEGRVQPLDSFARNTVRQLCKRESVYDGNLEKQPAIKWLADTLFDVPGNGDYRLYRIEDVEIIHRLELPETKEKEPSGTKLRFTFNQLGAGVDAFRKIVPNPTADSEDLSVLQNRLRGLYGKFNRNAILKRASALCTGDADVGDRFDFRQSDERLPRLVAEDDDGKTWLTFSTPFNRAWIVNQAKATDTRDIFALFQQLYQDDGFAEYCESLARERAIRDPAAIAAFRQSTDTEGKTDIEKVDLFLEPFRAQTLRGLIFRLGKMNGSNTDIGVEEDPAVELANKFQEIGVAWKSQDAEAFNRSVDEYLAMAQGQPALAGKKSGLDAEEIYNRAWPLFLAWPFYFLGFVVVLIGWFCIGFSKTTGRTILAIAVGITCAALLAHVSGLVMRVYISGRPPTTNLYSSAITVSAIFVPIMLLVEGITRIGLGTAKACIFGFAALVWAWSMSIVDGDTFSVLVAVLDTQFWLSTHVVCITIGYAVTFAAGVLGLGYILTAMLTPFLGKRQRKIFANLIYGVSCCALFFSFFGTVLGGLWGDDSWGRFWGWDPKENGALMIVLWSALLLHARWGGLVKERGIAVIAVIGNVIVLWSWKGVNSMGVGLHAYAASDDNSGTYILWVALAHLAVAMLAVLPTRFWVSHLFNIFDTENRLAQ